MARPPATPPGAEPTGPPRARAATCAATAATACRAAAPSNAWPTAAGPGRPCVARFAAPCCRSSRTAGTPAPKALWWTPGATSPAPPATASRGSTRAPVSTGGLGAGRSPFVQVLSNTEPPKIKCPRSRIKFADPGKLTARVSWDAPLATDTADKVLDVILVGQQPDSDFSEGANVIRYKVFDQARNRAACKFIIRVEVRRCPALPPPLHGSLACSSDLTNHGATCEYHCDGGYERGGVSSRRCQFDRSWSDEAAQCVAMAIKSDVKTASALLAQLFQKRRLLIVSAPDITDADYEMQNFMIQKSQCGLELRHVTLMQLLGSPPNHTGHIQEDYFTEQVVHQLRQTFRISTSYFSMVLVDKQGLDRERFIIPMSSEELFSYIDSFELDEEEREKLELHKHLCD
ncbi:sushi repeat-containing protein SRPX2 isoform X3 [Nerophis lumbriciformis]|uniref:sushi repeat-containing protein SRPX2 isoform X3 n=1 Tax=Nerophis lumbriciformis TaxID=546530 RepID=UPI003BABE8AA